MPIAPRGETQSKLVLLYTLEKFALPMHEQQLLRLMSELGYMNYFDLKQYLGELQEAGLIEEISVDGRKAFCLCQSAEQALQTLDKKLPGLVRAGVDEYLAVKRGELNAEMRTEAKISGKDDDLTVIMRVWEGGGKLIELKLPAVDEEGARAIMARWYDSAGEILKFVSDKLSVLK
ncbi:MAG: DUF4364 family protein [Christensenellales bacterium]|jgi:hypothetical protein